MTMKLILQEDVPHLGVVGDLVSVRDGYGRNYLIPQGKAILASRRSVAELDHQKRLAAKRREKAMVAATDARKKVESLVVVMQARVAPAPLNDQGIAVPDALPKLFGTITSRDVARVLKDSAGVVVDHRRITFDAAVRTVGKFEARIRLDGGVQCAMPFWVVSEGVAAADIEAEKKKVEAAQAEVRRVEAEALAAAKAEEAAAKAEFKASREKAEKDKADKEAAAAKEEAAAEAEGDGKKAKKKKPE